MGDQASSDRATDRVNQAARLTVGPAGHSFVQFRSPRNPTNTVHSPDKSRERSRSGASTGPGRRSSAPRTFSSNMFSSESSSSSSRIPPPPCRLRKNIVAHSSKRDIPVPTAARFVQSNSERAERETRPVRTQLARGRGRSPLCMVTRHEFAAPDQCQGCSAGFPDGMGQLHRKSSGSRLVSGIGRRGPASVRSTSFSSVFTSSPLTFCKMHTYSKCKSLSLDFQILWALNPRETENFVACAKWRSSSSRAKLTSKARRRLHAQEVKSIVQARPGERHAVCTQSRETSCASRAESSSQGVLSCGSGTPTRPPTAMH